METWEKLGSQLYGDTGTTNKVLYVGLGMIEKRLARIEALLERIHQDRPSPYDVPSDRERLAVAHEILAALLRYGETDDVVGSALDELQERVYRNEEA